MEQTHKHEPLTTTGLRRRAEEFLSNYRRDVAAEGTDDIQSLVRDLQAHLAELESDNKTLEGRAADTSVRLADIGERLQRAQSTIDQSREAVFWVRPDGRFFFVNDQATATFGYDRDELLASFVHDMDTAITVADWPDFWERTRREKLLLFESHMVGKDGGAIPIEVSASWHDVDGEEFLCAIVRDVSKRTQAQKRLRDSERRYRVLVENAPICIHEIDMDGRLLSMNPAGLDMAGMRCEEEVVGLEYLQVVSDRERDHIAGLLEQALQGNSSIFEFTTSEGLGSRIFTSCFVPLMSGDGHVERLMGITQDVTERRRAEAELKDSEQRLRAVLNAAADAIITVDRNGRIDSVNAATEKMFGYQQNELLGHNVNILMPWPCDGQHGEYVRGDQESAEVKVLVIGRQTVGRRKDGSQFPLDLSVSLFHDERGSLFAAIVRDISERQELQRQVLEIAAGEQQRIGQELHDNTQQQLTGLGLIARSLAVSMSEDNPFSENLREMAVRVADGLNQTLSDVTTLAHGLVPVEVDAQGLRAALAELAATIDGASSVACRFECAGAVEVPDNFVATHLYRIAQEAITNALKHSGANLIAISLAEDDDSIVLSVCDDGVGMEKAGSATAGRGVHIMNYRAGIIGASFELAPAEGGGTLATCKLTQPEVA